MRRSLRANLNRHGNMCCTLLVSLAILFQLGSCSSIPKQAEFTDTDFGSTGVNGFVSKQDGTAAVGAFVYAYRSARHGLRGPADFGIKVDRTGHYFLDLVEGDYHLVARLRQSGADVGPPRPGDAWSIFQHNPVQVAKDSVTPIDFKLQSSAVPRQVRQGSLTSGETGFSGKLINADGEPFAGAFALAYLTADFHRMPDLTSTPAGEDGHFTLYVSVPGIYCLAARSKTRGQPRTGEPYGTLGQKDEACRQVSTGEIIDIGTIVLTPYR